MFNAGLKGLDSFERLSVIWYEVDNFYDFLFVFLYSKRKEFASLRKGKICFLLVSTAVKKGGKNYFHTVAPH